MSGPIQQTYAPPDESLLGVVQSWVADLLGQQVPGSVVILIVIVAFAPMLIRAVMSYWKRR